MKWIIVMVLIVAATLFLFYPVFTKNFEPEPLKSKVRLEDTAQEKSIVPPAVPSGTSALTAIAKHEEPQEFRSRSFPARGISSRGLQSRIERVERVLTPFTLELANGEQVRLIGVDINEFREAKTGERNQQAGPPDANPVTAMMNVKALEFTKKMVEGKEVKLDFDIQGHDQQGRLLAYVYIIGCGFNEQTLEAECFDNYPYAIFLNTAIIRAGYAYATIVAPNEKFALMFLKAEKEARATQSGFWSEDFLQSAE